MRTLEYDGSQLLLNANAANPSPNARQVLIRLTHAGICNTDLELVKGYMGFRGVLGHEFVGVVEGGHADWMGRRVVGEINVADGTCDLCHEGVPSQCRHRTTVGINGHQGAFADYLTLDSSNLYAVPDTVTDDQAVFVEPLAAACQILEAVYIQPRDTVLVIGAGKLGLLCGQVLRLTGADVRMVIRRETQRALPAQWKLPAMYKRDLEPNRAQVVVDCTGTKEGFADALDLLRPRGTLVLKSTYEGLPLADLTRVVVNEIRVVGSRCGPFAAALRLLETGLVDVTSLIEDRYPFQDALKAFDHAFQPGVLKVLLDFQTDSGT